MPAKCHRWNFEAKENGVYVCKNLHEKGTPCQYEQISPFEIVDIIDEMRSKIFEYEAKIKAKYWSNQQLHPTEKRG